MQIASRIFRWAAIYGLIVLLPMFLLEQRFGQDNPPAITHAELYYGFVMLAVAWQVAFVVIGSNPMKFRLMMIPAIIEKFGWGLVAFGLAGMGRAVPATTLAFAAVDMALGSAFIYAWRCTARP
jgi:hypothetical protein